MQWSGEVLPEPAMIPDLGIFLRSASVDAQAVTTRGRDYLPSSQHTERRQELLAQAREGFPARLKLPFLLAPPGENKERKPDQGNVREIQVNRDRR